MRTEHAPTGFTDRTLAPRAGAVAALAGAALVHATVVSEHYSEWVLAGVFLLALQVLEAGLSLGLALARTRRTAWLVVVTGVGTAAVWAVSRTVGMPFGPAEFRTPEAVGPSDVACTILEVGSVLAAAVLLRATTSPAKARGAAGVPGARGRHRTRLSAATAVLAAVAVTAWGLGPAVGGAGGHHHAAASAAASATHS